MKTSHYYIMTKGMYGCFLCVRNGHYFVRIDPFRDDGEDMTALFGSFNEAVTCLKTAFKTKKDNFVNDYNIKDFIILTKVGVNPRTKILV